MSDPATAWQPTPKDVEPELTADFEADPYVSPGDKMAASKIGNRIDETMRDHIRDLFGVTW